MNWNNPLLNQVQSFDIANFQLIAKPLIWKSLFRWKNSSKLLNVWLQVSLKIELYANLVFQEKQIGILYTVWLYTVWKHWWKLPISWNSSWKNPVDDFEKIFILDILLVTANLNR